MYEVKWQDKFGFERVHNCMSLADALEYNKTVNRPGTLIIGEGIEIVGSMGVDSIKEGLCPNGVEYSLIKRR